MSRSKKGGFGVGEISGWRYTGDDKIGIDLRWR